MAQVENRVYGGRSKCYCCGARCDPSETASYLAQFAENPLIVKEVIWYYADVLQFGTEVANKVCRRCAEQDVMRTFEKYSWVEPDGYFELRGDEERWGRFADAQLAGPGSVLRPSQQRRTNMASKNQNQNDNVQETEVKLTEEERREIHYREVREALAEEFPIGSYVQSLSADFAGHQAEVVDIVTNYGVAYVQIKMLTYSDGRRRSEDKQKVLNVRPT